MAKGSVIVSDTNTLQQVAVGTTGQVLTSNGAGALPTMQNPATSGTVTHTGTLTNHALIKGNGGVDISALASLGTTTTVLHGNAAGDPTFAAVSLTSDVSGTLPVANGGTGVTASTGTVAVVLSTSPTLVTPLLGTPTSGTLTNCTGLPEGGLSLTDITTNNSSTSKHGFLLKLDNNSSHFMNGQGAWATPAGAGNVTTSATLTANKAIIGNGTSDVTVSAASGVAHLSSGTLTGSNVDLTSEVTGTLPVANGGTGVTSSTGTVAVVLSTSPTLVTPLLGTPTSGTLTNCTGLPEAGLTLANNTTNNVSITKHGFTPILPNDATKYLDGTGAYTVPAGSGGSGTVTNTGTLTANKAIIGNGGVDITVSAASGVAHLSSGTLTGSNVDLTSEVTGTLPVANGGTGITSFGTGIATFLGTPSSANLAATVTNETGSGLLVFATSPTLTTPLLGTPTSGVLTNCTGYTDANLSVSDITTNNVTSSAHGFAPKGDGTTTKFLNANGAYSTPSGTGAMTQLAQTVTSSSQASVDFTSISGSYTTLLLQFWAKDTASGNSVSSVRLRVNNDSTAANYTTTGRTGTSNGANFSSTDAAATTGGTIGNICNAGTTSEVGVGTVTIIGYASTAFFKHVKTEWSNFSTTANNQLGVSGFSWLSTSAITRLTVISAGTAFTDGSIFTLYGVA